MSRFIHDIDERYLQVSQTSAAIGEKVHTNSSFNRNVYDIFKSHTELNNSANNYDTKRLVPIAKAKQRPTNSATSNSEYSLHSADELNEGNLICHSRFGNGTITMVDTSGSDSKITVDFGDIGTRSLLLKFAKFKILK
jgi:DNA helicase-2/ATP-dependent DNA helicase PcrA